MFKASRKRFMPDTMFWGLKEIIYSIDKSYLYIYFSSMRVLSICSVWCGVRSKNRPFKP